MDKNIPLSCGGNVLLSTEKPPFVQCTREFERLVLFRPSGEISHSLTHGDSCTPSPDVCAAAIVRNGEIESFGQICPFNWSLAKSALASLGLARARGGTVLETKPKAEAAPAPMSKKEPCPLKAQTELHKDMFAHIFPRSEWRRLTYPQTSVEYITGRIYHKDALAATALGLPGRYAPAPPRSMAEFDIYLSAKNGGGYWLMFRDTEGVRLSREHVKRFMF